MPEVSNDDLEQMWLALERIEKAIDDLYINRKVFGAAKVQRLLLSIQGMKARVRHFQSAT